MRIVVSKRGESPEKREALTPLSSRRADLTVSVSGIFAHPQQ